MGPGGWVLDLLVDSRQPFLKQSPSLVSLTLFPPGHRQEQSLITNDVKARYRVLGVRGDRFLELFRRLFKLSTPIERRPQTERSNVGLAQRVACGQFLGALDWQAEIVERIGGEAPGEDHARFREVVESVGWQACQRLTGRSIASVVAPIQLPYCYCPENRDGLDGIAGVFRPESCFAEDLGGLAVSVSRGQEEGNVNVV